MAVQVESVKWVAGKFLVDGFAFQSPRCRHNFLTHYHSDHTVGLNRAFDGGLVYCSRVTRNLLVEDMGLAPALVRVLEMEVPVVVEGVRVCALPANHCPGAIMLLFEQPPLAPLSGPHGGGPYGKVILHTGDFRWQEWMAALPALRRVRVDTLYLDTTYAQPRWALPPQVRVHRGL